MAVPTEKTAPTIFFIPGAWHDVWVFDNLRTVLEDRGFETIAAELPTIVSKDASIGLAEDAKHVHSALTTLVNAGKEIIIVPHSYGGHVAANAVTGLGAKERAAAGLQGGVLMIANLATMIVPAGFNLLQHLGGNNLPWWDITEVSQLAQICITICGTLTRHSRTGCSSQQELQICSTMMSKLILQPRLLRE